MVNASAGRAILPTATVLFPVGEQRFLVRLSCVLGARMPTHKREATEDRTCNHEDRRDERDAPTSMQWSPWAAWSS
jgi:hypothetical protein